MRIEASRAQLFGHPHVQSLSQTAGLGAAPIPHRHREKLLQQGYFQKWLAGIGPIGPTHARGALRLPVLHDGVFELLIGIHYPTFLNLARFFRRRRMSVALDFICTKLTSCREVRGMSTASTSEIAPS